MCMGPRPSESRQSNSQMHRCSLDWPIRPVTLEQTLFSRGVLCPLSGMLLRTSLRDIVQTSTIVGCRGVYLPTYYLSANATNAAHRNAGDHREHLSRRGGAFGPK